MIQTAIYKKKGRKEKKTQKISINEYLLIKIKVCKTKAKITHKNQKDYLKNVKLKLKKEISLLIGLLYFLLKFQNLKDSKKSF